MLLAVGCSREAVDNTNYAIVSPEPSTPHGVYRLKEVDSEPRVILRPLPQFPFSMRREGQEGKVIVYFIVRGDGRITDVTITKATHADFAEAARTAVSNWRYEPAKVRDKPVDCELHVPITFTLSEE